MKFSRSCPQTTLIFSGISHYTVVGHRGELACRRPKPPYRGDRATRSGDDQVCLQRVSHGGDYYARPGVRRPFQVREYRVEVGQPPPRLWSSTSTAGPASLGDSCIVLALCEGCHRVFWRCSVATNGSTLSTDCSYRGLREVELSRGRSPQPQESDERQADVLLSVHDLTPS